MSIHNWIFISMNEEQKVKNSLKFVSSLLIKPDACRYQDDYDILHNTIFLSYTKYIVLYLKQLLTFPFHLKTWNFNRQNVKYQVFIYPRNKIRIVTCFTRQKSTRFNSTTGVS